MLNVPNHACLSVCVTKVMAVLFVKDMLSIYNRRKQHGQLCGLKCLQISFFTETVNDKCGYFNDNSSNFKKA
jgi:hypothetical protein